MTIPNVLKTLPTLSMTSLIALSLVACTGQINVRDDKSHQQSLLKKPPLPTARTLKELDRITLLLIPIVCAYEAYFQTTEKTPVCQKKPATLKK